MKGEVFSTWFKELCSLIFVQAFQAFLFAIVITMVITMLGQQVVGSANAAEFGDAQGSINAIGIFAILALSSFGKIELLVKKIFGLTSGVGDPSLQAGRKSLTGSMLALKGFGRTLDNGRKAIGGGVKAIGSQLKMRQLRNERDAEAIRAKNAANEEATLGPGSGTGGTNGGSGSGSRGSSTTLKQALDDLRIAVADSTAAVNKQTNEAGKNKSDEKIKALNDAIKQAKDDRNKGLKEAISGVSESVGAIHGAIGGAVAGLATGDVAKTMMQAAGVGDVIGEKVAKAVSYAPSAAKTVVQGVGAELEAHVPSSKSSAYKAIEKELMSKDKKDLDDLKDQIRKYNQSRKNSSKDTFN